MKVKFAESFKLTLALVREQALPLLGLFIVSCCLNVTCEDAMQLLTPKQETERWTLQLGIGIWELKHVY